MKALERLEKLLDEKDARIEELEGEIQEQADAREERDWEWTRHAILKDNPENLPVPRLEIRWEAESEDGYLQRWDYSLIYRHLLGHLVRIPMGQTKTQGSTKPPIFNGALMMPYRDGAHICHDSMMLGLPAFAVADGRIEKLSTVDGKNHQEPYAPEAKP